MVQQILRGDGCIVEEAVAAVEIDAGMMPGRAAQGEGGTRTLPDDVGGGERDVGSGARSLPGAIAYRGFAGNGVITQLAGDVLGAALDHTARGPAVGNGLAFIASRSPPGPGRGQEVDEVPVVHA